MDNRLIKNPTVRYRHVCDMDFLIDVRLGRRHSVRTMHINEVTAYLWTSLGESEEFDVDTLVKLLLKEYEVEEETARNDMEALVNSLLKAGVIFDKNNPPKKKTRIMKKKPGFRLREVCGEKFLIAEGLENIDFSKLVSLNETSAFLWESVGEDEEFSVDSLTQLLLQEYEIDEETARNDVKALLRNMLETGVIE